MIGLPTETPVEFAETLYINQKIQPAGHDTYIFFPYPDTQLFDFRRYVAVQNLQFPNPDKMQKQMKNQQKIFSVKRRLASFRFAFEGLKFFIKTEHNAWIHAAVTLAVCALGAFYKISKTEWIAVCIVIGLVFSMEMINTAIEKLCDFVSPEKRAAIKFVKDISAAAVLISAAVAAIAGFLIFLPKII